MNTALTAVRDRRLARRRYLDACSCVVVTTAIEPPYFGKRAVPGGTITKAGLHKRRRWNAICQRRTPITEEQTPVEATAGADDEDHRYPTDNSVPDRLAPAAST